MPRKEIVYCNEISSTTGEPCQKPVAPGSDKCGWHKELPNDRRCTAINATDGKRCRCPAMVGNTICFGHGGGERTALKAARVKILEMVFPAFATLNRAMEYADYAVAVRAAQIILDRAGFGPSATLNVEDKAIDLSTLSREQLLERTAKVQQLLLARAESEDRAAAATVTNEATNEPTNERMNENGSNNVPVLDGEVEEEPPSIHSLH